jgi:hypothetical protein
VSEFTFDESEGSQDQDSVDEAVNALLWKTVEKYVDQHQDVVQDVVVFFPSTGPEIMETFVEYGFIPLGTGLPASQYSDDDIDEEEQGHPSQLVDFVEESDDDPLGLGEQDDDEELDDVEDYADYYGDAAGFDSLVRQPPMARWPAGSW